MKTVKRIQSASLYGTTVTEGVFCGPSSTSMYLYQTRFCINDFQSYFEYLFGWGMIGFAYNIKCKKNKIRR
jgi:hypothetical protein